MAEPSGPLNGQGRVVEGLVMPDGSAGFRQGVVPVAVAGSAYNAMDQTMAWPSLVAISQTPTITAGAYSAGDAVGGKMTFAGAQRAQSRGCLIQTVEVSDKNPAVLASLELWVCAEDFTAMTDNAAWARSDADAVLPWRVIPLNAWYASTLNATCIWTGAMGIVSSGTELYAQLVTRTAPTYTSTSDLKVTLIVQPD